MIKLCIFDLDGTLLNTLPTIAYYGNLVLGKHGLAPIDEERYKILVGDGRDMLIHRMLAESGNDSPALYERVGAAYDAAYEADVMYLTKPYEGILEMLSSLKGSGMKLAVLSNKPDNVVRPIVKEVFGNTFCEIWGKRFDYPVKPAPDAAFEICRSLEVSPENTAFIGDTSVDIKTGKNGGFFTIGAQWGFRTRKELENAGADAIAACAKDVADLLKNSK